MNSTRPPLFWKRWFEPTMIVTCVRWYLRFSLSLRDVKELMAERGLSVHHTSVWRWTQAYGPEICRRLQGEVKRKSSTWHMDETFVRVAGRWAYRGLLPFGNTGLRSRKALPKTSLSESRQSASAGFRPGRTAQLSRGYPRVATGRSFAPPLPATHSTIL